MLRLKYAVMLNMVMLIHFLSLNCIREVVADPKHRRKPFAGKGVGEVEKQEVTS
jgi:hypothetical protein